MKEALEKIEVLQHLFEFTLKDLEWVLRILKSKNHPNERMD